MKSEFDALILILLVLGIVGLLSNYLVMEGNIVKFTTDGGGINTDFLVQMAMFNVENVPSVLSAFFDGLMILAVVLLLMIVGKVGVILVAVGLGAGAIYWGLMQLSNVFTGAGIP